MNAKLGAHRSGRRRTVVANLLGVPLLALSMLAGVLPQTLTSAHADTVTDPPVAQVDTATDGPGPVLPFDLPSTSSLRSSGKLVFAHYWPPLPVSIDNQAVTSDYYARNYLTPGGENGKHAAYGGYLRDRPIPRPPRAESTWRLSDAEAEVRQAIAAGLDGFTLDVMQLPGDPDTQQWSTVNLMLAGAQAVDPGFKIMLMPDMSGSMVNKSTDVLAQYMAQLGKSKSAYRLSDGRLLISPFDAQAHSADWWSTFMDTMKNKYSTPVALVPVFQDERPYASAFKPISYAMSHWGSRNPLYNDPISTAPTSRMGRVAAIHAMGEKWMQPVSVQDERPNQGIFDEAENTTNLRDTWKIAINSHSEWVQMPTWNDYSEGADINPSMMHGWSYLDISSYYLTWFKTGAAPKIARDTVYLTHRTQPVAAKPSYAETKLMTLRGGSPARDTVEALTFLTAPATVTVTVGSKSYACAAAAGVDTCTVPLGTGTASAKVTRAGATVAVVTSPHMITATPYVQDLSYVAASSRREGGVAVATSQSSVTPIPETVDVTPVADSYANQGAPSSNYGSTTSLISRGSVGSTPYIRYNVPATPENTTLTGAALSLRTTTDSASGSGDKQSVTVAPDTWTESALTWNNRPAAGTKVLGSIAGGTVPDTLYTAPLDVTAVRAMTGSAQTLALTSTGSDNMSFWSRQFPTAGYPVRLRLTYTPVVPDTQAPSAPSGLTATPSGSSVDLSWTASSDDVKVSAYSVYRSATPGFTPSSASLVGTTAGTSYTDSSAPVGLSYYRVVASDAAGNDSGASNESSAVAADSTAPSVPTDVAATLSGTSVTTTWTASTDDVAVSGYDVYRSASAGAATADSTLVGSTAGTSYTEDSVPAGTWYYRVVSTDAAGNLSGASSQGSVVVPAPASSPELVAGDTTSMTVRPTADTYANAGAPSTSFDTSSTMTSRGSIAAISYLRFAIPAAPAGKTLTGAVLRIRTSSATFAGSGDTFSVRTASDSWSGSSLTWNNRPAVGSTVLATLAGGTLPNTGYDVPLDVAGLQSLVGGQGTVALTGDGSDNLQIWSGNYAATGSQPQLVLSYS